MRREQQVLRRHGGALYRHHVLGLAPTGVGIAIHVRHREADQDDERRVGDARMGSRDIARDVGGIIPVRQAVRAERSPIPTASRSFQETSSISTKRQGWRLCADGAQVGARSNCSVSDGLILPPT
jgi:hypothetical protein